MLFLLHWCHLPCSPGVSTRAFLKKSFLLNCIHSVSSRLRYFLLGLLYSMSENLLGVWQDLAVYSWLKLGSRKRDWGPECVKGDGSFVLNGPERLCVGNLQVSLFLLRLARLPRKSLVSWLQGNVLEADILQDEWRSDLGISAFGCTCLRNPVFCVAHRPLFPSFAEKPSVLCCVGRRSGTALWGKEDI